MNGTEFQGSLDKYINVDDVAYVKVIKDHNIDKYGERGKNGVVEITLKEGRRLDSAPMDTVIVYNPVTFTETVKIVPIQERSLVKVNDNEMPIEIDKMDTLIIFDPETYTKNMIIRPLLDKDFEITLS